MMLIVKLEILHLLFCPFYVGEIVGCFTNCLKYKILDIHYSYYEPYGSYSKKLGYNFDVELFYDYPSIHSKEIYKNKDIKLFKKLK